MSTVEGPDKRENGLNAYGEINEHIMVLLEN
jgi:hypothetical protein